MGCTPSKRRQTSKEQPMLYLQASRVINFEKHKCVTKLSTQRTSNRITNMKAYKNFSASTPSLDMGMSAISSPTSCTDIHGKNTTDVSPLTNF